MKIKFSFLIGLSILINSCDKLGLVEVEKITLPELTTSNISKITDSSATMGGEITNDGGGKITQRGVCYSTTVNPTTENNVKNSGTETGTFEINIKGLSAHTTYYVRAFAINPIGTSYGNQISFTTLALATLTTNAVTSITSTTAVTGGNISSDGGASVTERGVCYSTSPNPTTTNNLVSSGSDTGSFTSNITGLLIGTTYYVRAYATNSIGTSYGNQVLFSTLGLATLTTNTVSSITGTTAVTGGNITNDGGASVTERGVCYSTSPNPTTTNNLVTSGSGTGTFTANLSNLTLLTTYYVRAYAKNSIGTSYGNQISFTTLALATLTTNAVTSITSTTAVTGGNITNDGGASVTERGVCYSTSQNPTIANIVETSGSGTGTFTANLSNLTLLTTYYVRAYAKTSIGTSYGNQISFTTLAILATLTTNAVTSITGTTAVTGGNITSDGGASVTERGVCYSTSQNPTIASSVVSSGSSTGTFTANLSGLSSATTYYVRAYAKNSIGTSYGNQISFTTLQMSWSKSNIGSSYKLNSVFFSDSVTGYTISEEFRQVFKTTDGGTNWFYQTSLNDQLYSIYFTSTNTGYLIGSSGGYKTNNGGTNWNYFGVSSGPFYSIYFANTDIGYSAGWGGIIIKTVDRSNNWTQQTSGTTRKLNSIYFTSTNNGFVVGDYGEILNTTNGGSSWTKQTSGTTYFLNSVYFTDSNNGYAVGEEGTILKTTNGGSSWTKQTSGTSNWLTSVYFCDANIGYVVGYNGTILNTTNGGTSWTVQTSGTVNDLHSVFFTSYKFGCAVGRSGTILIYK